MQDGTARRTRTTRFAVIGAGISGILAAIKLKEAGFERITVYEKAECLGGTWRENTYPGVACDVPSHVYSYSFAPNPDWSQRFAPGPEIYNYLEDVARRHGVLPLIRFGDEVIRLTFADGRWELLTASGHRNEMEIVIGATGVLHHPQIPELKGLDRFEGSYFHSARWDHDVPLNGKRIGIVGTGSTAVQIVSALVERAAQLTLFQRTAQWMLPLDEGPYSEEDRQRFREQPETLAEVRAELSRRFAGGISDAVVDANSALIERIGQACREYLERSVADPDLRERLRPSYRPGCKRLVFSSRFYEAIQRPNAALVTDAIDCVEGRGIRTVDGRLHELDVLVLATGFRVDRFLRPIEVIGRDGVCLDEVWAKRPSAYLAVSVPHMPNLFLLNGPTGPVGNFSLIEVAELQMAYVMQLIEEVAEGRCSEINASQAAAHRYDDERIEAARNTIWATGCQSWYLDDRGIPVAWPWTFERFRQAMSRPLLEDYERVGPTSSTRPYGGTGISSGCRSVPKP